MNSYALFEVSKATRPELSDTERDIKSRIVADFQCHSVWTAIAKRKAKASRIPEDSHALCLFGYARSAFLGPSDIDKVSRAKRAKLGKEVAVLAGELQEKLVELRSLGDVPPEILNELTGALQRSYGYYRPVRVNPDRQGRLSNLSESIFALALDGIARHAFFDGDLTVNVLYALSLGAKSWALTEPLQYRASDGSHVHFVKAMGLYFKQHYGTPLHEQVAVLTNCLFGTTLTKAGVSDITNKRVRGSGR